ncbi:MAG: VOC family protein [Calditrichaeota bacterium]|jgi:uncharacterized protein|nr:VOC family protein [Calditrichota bacterium]MBT7616367.1 VOC family protein [Calditrichota bacterium]MBT7788192.1 VOC family protein [Calditrichota bacterium]
MGAPVEWFEIQGKNGEVLKDFYSGLFGWKISSDNSMNYGHANTDSGKGIGGGICTNEKGESRVTVYITVRDINLTLDKVKANGGSVFMERTEHEGQVTIAILKDPAGNKIGLVERKED